MKLRAASQQKQLHPLREGTSWKDKMSAELMKLINQHLSQQKSQDFAPTSKAQDTIGELARSYKTSYFFGTRLSYAGCQGLVLRLHRYFCVSTYYFYPPTPFLLLPLLPADTNKIHEYLS